MRLYTLSCFMLFFLLSFHSSSGLVQQSSPVVPAPTYTTRTVRGWTIHINNLLLEKDQATATEAAFVLLQKQLVAISRVVPQPALGKLREVAFWISPEYPGIGPRAEYHPGADWLRANGRNPDMVKGIEITNVRIFDKESVRMPWFILHELAHSYHDRVLGFDHQEILATYGRAKLSGRYDRVQRFHGDGQPNTIEKAYAMTNVQEYFAESTEAFFGRNDFYPFNRSQLGQTDPEMAVLLDKVWFQSKSGSK